MRQCWRVLWVFCLLMPVGSVEAQSGAGLAGTTSGIVVAPHTSYVKTTSKPITRIAVADPTIADAELLTPTQVLIVAQEKLGITSLILWHGDQHADVYEIEVKLHDKVWSDIQGAIRRLVPRARVRVERLGNGVMLDGVVESQKDLERVVEITRSFAPNFSNMVSVMGSQQVQLEVRIAELSRSGIQQLGLGFLLDKDWKVAVFPAGTVKGSLTGARQRGFDQTAEDTDSTVSSLVASAVLASPFGSAFQVLAGGDDFLGIMSLLKGQGVSRLLASPTLVTMSGQEAEFLVGGEFPYPVTDENGTTNVQFKKFGIMLRFTPYVMGDETITLQVEPEVSALDFSLLTISGGTAVPGLSTRRGQSKLQLKDGQTFAMAGLLREETRSAVSKIPFLGDIPVLGTLFTSKEFQNNESELVIVVKPRIVRALNPDEVGPLPGEDHGGGVGDLDFFIRNRVQPASRPVAPPGYGRTPLFVGEIGFMR